VRTVCKSKHGEIVLFHFSEAFTVSEKLMAARKRRDGDGS